MASKPPTEPDSGALTARGNFFSRNQFVFSLLLPALLMSIGRGFTMPVIPLIARDEFGVDPAGAVLTIIAPMAGGVLSTLPTGYLIDRFGRRATLIVAPLVMGLAAFLVFFAGSYWQFLGWLTVGGVAQQSWQMSRMAAIADSVRSSQRGRQITTMSSMQRLGSLGGPFLGGLLGAVVDLRAPFLVFGVLALLAVVPSYLLIKETAPSVLARRTGTEVEEVDTSWAKLLTRSVLTLFAAQFSANLARGGIQGHGGTYFIFLAFAYDKGPLFLGSTMAATGIVAVPVMLLSGQIMDRWGRKRQIVPATLTLGGGIGLMAVTAALSLSIVMFVVAFVWINIGISMMAGTMQTLGTDVAPPSARGKFFGVNRLIAEAGSLTNPVAFGTVVALVGGAAGYAGAFAVMAGAALVSANLVGFGLRETLRKDEPRRERASRD